MVNVSKEEMYSFLMAGLENEPQEILALIEEANAAKMSVIDYVIKSNKEVIKLANGNYTYNGQCTDMTIEELILSPVTFETNIYEDELDDLVDAFKLAGVIVEADEPYTSDDDTLRVNISWVCNISEFMKAINNIDNEDLENDLLYILQGDDE